MNQKDVGYYETPWGKEPYCKKCGSDVLWHECENCEEGYSGHDCGEDTCCCLDPLPNVVCDCAMERADGTYVWDATKRLSGNDFWDGNDAPNRSHSDCGFLLVRVAVGNQRRGLKNEV